MVRPTRRRLSPAGWSHVASSETSSAYPGLLSFLTGIDVTARLAQATPWCEADRLLAAGRLDEALAVLDRIGARTDAAIVRVLLAQRQGMEPWATEAEAFFAGVGATRFLAEIDSLRAGRRSA